MYRYDMRDKTPQQQAIVRKRDEENARLKKDSENKRMTDKNKAEMVYRKSLFMRLGKNPTTDWDGEGTIQAYKDFCQQNSSVWFSTDSLNRGMAEEKVREFKNAIKNGYAVFVYFAIGNTGNGVNEIEYRANVLDIKSGEKTPCPDRNLTPSVWANDPKNIWININNIQIEPLKTIDFIVISSGKILRDSIANSQFHFGYITKR